MPFYYYLFLITLFSFIILLIRFFVLRRKSIPSELLAEALQDENNGHFEAAVITYESVLNEIKKIRFHNDMKNKITEKLKVLHTSIEFVNSFRFTLPGGITNIDRGS